VSIIYRGIVTRGPICLMLDLFGMSPEIAAALSRLRLILRPTLASGRRIGSRAASVRISHRAASDGIVDQDA